MPRLWTGMAATVVAAMAMIGTAGPAAATTGSHDWDDSQSVSVTDGSPGPAVSKTWLQEGTIKFKISTKSANGLDVTLFKLRRGAHFSDVTTGVQEEFGPTPALNAKGTRDLIKAADFHGLADVVPGSPVTVTEHLNEGTYYAFALDPNSRTPAPPTLKNVTVIHVGEGDADDEAAPNLHRLPSITLTSADRFKVSGHLPAHGSVLIKNRSDSIHITVFQRVKPGTTDAQVQAYFDSHSQTPPPFGLPGPSIGMDVLSPRNQLVLSYSLPKGTYVLLCFVADADTGMPHAFMGMHKIVTLG